MHNMLNCAIKTCKKYCFYQPFNWVTQLVIVSDQQTNSHSYVRALAPFSSGAVPRRPLKAEELVGQGFKSISSFSTVAITTHLVPSFIYGRFIYVGSTNVFFSFFFSWLERRVTGKNSHQLACHFPVVFCLTRGFSGTLLVSVVKTPFQFTFEKYSKNLFSQASWLLTRIRPVPHA